MNTPINQATITQASLDKATMIQNSFVKTLSSEEAAKSTMDVVKVMLVAVAFVIVSLVIDKKE